MQTFLSVLFLLTGNVGSIPHTGLQDSSEQWTSFRGSFASGVSEGHELPLEWSVEEDQNIGWRVPIPGLAHSSPVVFGDRVFVTTAIRKGAESEISSLFGSENYGAGESVTDEGQHTYRLYCLSLATGAVLWQRDSYVGTPKTKRHPKSTHANSSPACDAERVVAFFGSEGLFCYDHTGELLWSRDFGVLDAGAPDLGDREINTDEYQWGFASSPVFHDGRLIVQCDVQGQSFLTALDASTGEEIWRTNRDENPTWSSPTIRMPEKGAPQVLVNGFLHIGGYDLATGKEIWKASGGGDVPVPTPIIAHGLAIYTSAHGPLAPLYAVGESALGDLELGSGDPSNPWYYPRRGIYMQTPLVYGYELYACNDAGVVACLDVLTGERVFRERLGNGRAGFSASAVAGDGKIYFTSEAGTVYVLEAGREFRVLAENDLGENCLATPAIAGGRLLFRTAGHLLAVGE